jgi:predicted dehydrogenase
MKPIKVGVIGCGKQASKHIAGLKKIPGTEIVLADIQSEFAKAMAAKNGCQYVSKPDDVFDARDVQAVIICTPTQTHVPIIKQALEAGNHVFCEKPLSDRIQEIDELKEMAARTDCIVTVGYVYRHVPAFEEGYRIFRQNRYNGENLLIGEPVNAFFRLGGRGSHQAWKHRKESGGGAINEMLVHMIDLANWYFGPLNNLKVVSNHLYLKERKINGEKVSADAEDYIMVQCKGVDGIEIFCQADLVTPAFSQYLEVQGENGSFRGSIQQDSPSYLFLNESRGGYDAGKTTFSFGQRNLLDYQMLSFILSVLQNEKPEKNTIDDSLQLIRIIDQIKSQIQE